MSSSPGSPEPQLSPPAQDRLRDSTHLISTEEEARPPKFVPFQLEWWVVGPTTLIMVGFGIALEIALHFSQKNNGFRVPQKNALKFASTEFLTSFFPILIVIPLAFFWTVSDAIIKRYQPFLTMSQKRARAEQSLLLDYINENTILLLFRSVWRGHWLVFFSAVTSLLSIILQPLAGSIFSVSQVAHTRDATVTAKTTVGLDPDVSSLGSFLSSAGYVDAAVQNGLGDPPYINGSWAVAEFAYEQWAFAGNVTAPTYGIRSNASCTPPATFQFVTSQQNDGGNITATSVNGCTITATFDESSSDQQYNVMNVPNCGPTADRGPPYQPAFFYFYQLSDGDGGSRTAEAAGVFCFPTIEIFNVNARANLDTNTLQAIEIVSQIENGNNVTDAPFSGVAYNGVAFNTTGKDDFVKSRATATGATVAGAIFRAAKQGNLDQIFNSSNGFLDITQRIYTQYLSVVAKNTYLIPNTGDIDGILVSFEPRLFIQRNPAHTLSFFMILIGLAGMTIHIAHARARRNLYLTAFPGSLAASIALTSHSGFGKILYPFDTEESMKKKLKEYVFFLDPKSGAVLAAPSGAGGESGDLDGMGEMGGSAGDMMLVKSKDG